MKTFGTSFVAASAFFFACGCGGGAANKAEVTGTVSYKDQPLTNHRIAFYDNKNQLVGSAPLGATGNFTATDLPPEELKVALLPDAEQKVYAGVKAPPKTAAVPEKYRKPETSGLSYKISSGQNLAVKLD